MSWFKYETPKRRSLRKGVWVRYQSLSKELYYKIYKQLSCSEQQKYYIAYIVVKEIRPNNLVLLEAWFNCIGNINKSIIIHHETLENPEWICEGDLGRGYKE